MPTLFAPQLKQIACDTLTAAGSLPEESRIVADALVEANLAGHDSHGALRIPEYTRWVEEGLVSTGAEMTVVEETESFALVDGNWGWGQVMGRRAMHLGIEKAVRSGVATISARRCCHLGRIGDYPLMAAERGLATVMFVNTHGGGKLVAPFGGMERRLSANPISVGIPRSAGVPIIVDISTCAIAEGKLRGMRNSGRPVPAGCIIDAQGNPTTDADAFYGPPPGALLPFGGHKGYALGLIADILAGAISGAGCSNPDTNRVGNAFFATIIDAGRIRGKSDFENDVEGLIEWVKSSRLSPGSDQIQVPGEPEALMREQRLKFGIPIDDVSWSQIRESALRYGVDASIRN